MILLDTFTRFSIMFLFRVEYLRAAPVVIGVLFLMGIAWSDYARHAPWFWLLGVMLFVVFFPVIWVALCYTMELIFGLIVLLIGLIVQG